MSDFDGLGLIGKDNERGSKDDDIKHGLRFFFFEVVEVHEPNFNVFVVFEQFFAGGDVQWIVVYSQNSGMIENMHDSLKGSSCCGSNIKHVFDFKVSFVSFSDESIGVSQ